jgi:tetratricopeptide (TPR) repeat protein
MRDRAGKSRDEDGALPTQSLTDDDRGSSRGSAAGGAIHFGSLEGAMSDTLDAATLVPTADTDDASNQLGLRIDGQADRSGASRWRRLLECLPGIEKNVRLAVLLVVTVLGVSVVIKGALKPVYMIEAISVPKELEERGYTSMTVGRRIVDALNEIDAARKRIERYGAFRAPTGPWVLESDSGVDADTRSVFRLSNELSDNHDISFGGASLATVIFYLRDLFGQTDTRISGEITIGSESIVGVTDRGEVKHLHPPTYSLRLRITTDSVLRYETEPNDKLDALFAPAASHLMERIDPLGAAYYSYSINDTENAQRTLKTYFRRQKEDKEYANKEEHVAALNLRALIAHQKKDYKDAIDQFNDAIPLHPHFPSLRYNLGYVLIERGRDIKQKNPDAANRDFDDARDAALEGLKIETGWLAWLGPATASRGTAIGYATAARALHQMGKYGEALDSFGVSVELDPTFAYAQFMRGWVYGDRVPFDLDSAINNFQRAAEIDPSFQIYTYWGKFVLDHGQRDEARRLFERAAKANPKIPDALNRLGLLDLEELKWDKAEEMFRGAIERSRSGSPAEYHRNLGRALRGLGKIAGAMAEFQRATELDEMDGKSCAEWGRALAESAKVEDGNVAADKIAEIDKKLNKARRILPDDDEVVEIIRDVHRILGLPGEILIFPM